MPIARVALPVAAPTLFDYWVPQGLALTRGNRVRVLLGPRTLTGVVVAVVEESQVGDRLAPIVDVAPGPPLPDDVLDLAQFVADYYHAAPGLAFALAVPPRTWAGRARRSIDSLRMTAEGAAELPAALARAPAGQALLRRFTDGGGVLDAATIATLPPHSRRTLRSWRERGFVDVAQPSPDAGEPVGRVLNAGQAEAAREIAGAAGSFAVFLLNGVTGSGKTEVYLAAADAMLARGCQVLLLVPEINLTPQLVARVKAARPRLTVAVLHSALPSGERHAQWLAAATGTAQLVLGTRLAVFAALPRLGLVIVDEEHDGSYKQQDNVRYHARDAAIWRARRRAVPIVLGSATPSLETWLGALEGRYRRLDLPDRGDPRAVLPVVRLTGNRTARDGEGIGEVLRTAIAARLARGEQSLVFVNRRGYSPSLICAACKWDAQCPRCSARLTTHRVPPSLRCHHCGHAEPVPRACPSCGNVDLVPLGFGTQRLERALAAAFPSARIARIDRDTTRARHAFASLREEVEANALDILVGTQMLAKGHDFPRLTLVGVLGADNALYSADFRATERLAALLVQVAGRAGRAGLPGEVVVQTDFPDHPVFAALVAHDYPAFAQALLEERRAAQLPPYTHAALLAVEAHGRAAVEAFLARAHAAAATLARAEAGVEVFAPVPALLARRAGFERGQLVVQSERRPPLQRFLTAWLESLSALPGRSTRWSLDIDPAGFG